VIPSRAGQDVKIRRGGPAMAEPTSIAAIADVHGNRWALDAVLADIRRRGIERIVNLGDCVYGPLDPAGTADVLIDLAAPTVRGNEDRLIVEDATRGEAVAPSLQYTRSQLQPRHLRWLEALPMTAVAFSAFFLCHGSPLRDDEYLLHKVTKRGVEARPPEELVELVAAISRPIILCGHDHLPHLTTLADGRHIIGPGSVGLPAYVDDQPRPHAMSAGSPHARYAIVRPTSNAWEVEHVTVAYDHAAAAAAADPYTHLLGAGGGGG